jgi:hypothetical protein
VLIMSGQPWCIAASSVGARRIAFERKGFRIGILREEEHGNKESRP